MPLSILLAIRKALVTRALKLQQDKEHCLPKHVNDLERLMQANDAALRWLDQQQANDVTPPQLQHMLDIVESIFPGVKHGS
jgi:hypothetical protein